MSKNRLITGKNLFCQYRRDVLSREVADLIPRNEKYDMNEFIDSVMKNDYRVSTYPVDENDYIKIGQ